MLIELGNRTSQRIQVLFWGEFLFTTGMATILLLQALPLVSFAATATGVGAAALYALAAYRFLARMFARESILLSVTDISLIKKTPFGSRVRSYKWGSISPLFYWGAPQKTDHPMKGQSFDYFGFDTHEHLIQQLHNEGNLYFNHDCEAIHFAAGVYSWNAEEMVSMMKLFAGDNLRLGPELTHIIKNQEIDS